MKQLFPLVLVLTLALFGCGNASTGAGPDASPSGPGETRVFAAASLTKALPEVASGNVAYSFDGSSGLVDQIVGGAPADVFASADKRNMDKAVAANVIDGTPAMFATNYLVLVVPPGNPGKVTGFDASLNGVKLVVCAPEVPCGAATRRVAERAGLALRPVSEEPNVTDVLGKVTSGEADAGVVYATDAASAGDKVTRLEIAGAKDDPNTYWIAKVAKAPNPAGADAFIAHVLSPDGQQVLTRHGFGPPR